jgi:hypothetical protein
MSWDVIIQAVIVAAVTGAATGFVNGKVMQAHFEDLKDRVVRIETHLNGLLKKL